jgi:hypothetical protein
MERMDGALTKMASQINIDIWQANGVSGGNPSIVGFPTAISSTGAYAGISKASFPEWAGNTIALGGPLTFDSLYLLDQNIYVSSGKTAKVITCAPDVYRKYADLFETIKRVFVSSSGEVPVFTGGERELFWKGMPVLRDKDMTAGTLAMLNTDDIKIRPLTGVANQDGVASMSRMAPSSNGETDEASPIACDVFPLARTGSAQKFLVETYIQLQLERVNSHGYITGIQ